MSGAIREWEKERGGAIVEYSRSPSVAATLAARALEKGDEEAALIEASAAAKTGDLLHPSLWGVWEAAGDELFERAVDLLSAAELERLRFAQDARGSNWAAALASPRKIKALSSRGLDPSKETCRGESGHMDAATHCCWSGEIERLEALMMAGAPPPKALREGAGAGRSEFGGAGPATPLQALAMSYWVDAKIDSPERAERARGVIRWLCSEGVGVDAVNGNGDDALKLAIYSQAGDFAGLLLDCGARLEDRDDIGESAWDLLSLQLQERDEGAPEVRRLRALEGKMKALKEAGEIASAVVGGPPGIMEAKPRARV